MTARIELVERGETLTFTPDDLLLFHGPGSPGGVAIAFQVLARALPLLAPSTGEPCERRAVRIRTPFPGPGARDAFEMATRAVSDGRFTVDPAQARPDLGRTRERFVFVVAHHADEVTLTLEAGFVTEEFVDLVAVDGRSAEQERHLDELKRDLARRVLAAPAADVFSAVASARRTS